MPEAELNERADLADLAGLRALSGEGSPHLAHEVLCEVMVGTRRFPVQAYTLGNPDPEVPAVGFFGGVHGLERIGAEVVIAYLHSLIKRLAWDAVLHRELEQVRLVFMPMVNPGGVWRGTRANPNGVDLMRNAPLDARSRVPFLVGGQRLSAGLPWYRGPRGAAMEMENQAVCTLVERELLPHRFSLVVDCHSGFGVNDRIWFPHAHTPEPIAHLPELHALKAILDQTQLHHPYVFEPQSRQYLAHGDLWDYLYLQACAASPRVFLPLTLEMGSWMWVRKNPRQLFTRHGLFNPLIAHRQQRVLRRHLGWLDFVVRAAIGHRRWMPEGAAREWHHQQALALWYRGRR
ncbi:zinc carboxypeptidase [Sphaerotilus hippei]|uniref:Zinc carboxypeptidase n=1 Tax=Sphaerotilus hippei TaxID=744406 RepID=A0A318HGR0_9BURK|nr:zinc carboxypeptidase [Sphaerotilus hippei]